MKKLARCYGLDVIEKLYAMVNDETVPAATRKAAMDSLLDRGYGKAIQHIEAGGPGAFENLTDEELETQVMARARRLVEGRK